MSYSSRQTYLDHMPNSRLFCRDRLPSSRLFYPTFRRYLSQFNFQLNCSK
ncbi:hypothetical protein NO976_00315 [Planktothrix agardhii]|nr:hypothetical protein [Planktothrix agardhii]CAD5915225.1 hypothetical protein NO976_00315 [Planktothrix agardhii]